MMSMLGTSSMDITLAEASKTHKKGASHKRKSRDPPDNPNPAQLLLTAPEQPSIDIPPEIQVSEFDYSVDNHFKFVDTITKLCGYPKTIDDDPAEIQRFSDSITFLTEWRDFKYAPKVVEFACQHNLKETDALGGITLPQFSAAAVPKTGTEDGNKITGTKPNNDFVMNVGGAVWALDWCQDDRSSGKQIKPEFLAVAAHPPESSYHKIGAPLKGRGVIQIWCLLSDCANERCEGEKPRGKSKKNKAVESSDPAKLLKPRGRPRKKPVDDSLKKPSRPRGRPRKKPFDDSVQKLDTDSPSMQPIAVDHTECSSRLLPSDRSIAGDNSEDSGLAYGDPNQKDNTDIILLTAPKDSVSKRRGQKRDQVHSSAESSLPNPDASSSCSLDSMMPNKSATETTSADSIASNNVIPRDVALPRMMLCLAHNGKVAWDLKWRPFNVHDPGSLNKMGFLAVLLGNGALEVWEVPLPQTVKRVYPAFEERMDPRFIKLRPVFRCSMLKCGDRQSIPLTLEWSVSSPHDIILAGCHDGVVALWKFSTTSSSTDTRPLLCFNADTVPIRTLAWAPNQSDLEGGCFIVTAGHRGFKFWDIRDPFRPMWEHKVPEVTYSVDWLRDPRCVFGCTDDGTLWSVSLVKVSNDIPVSGKSGNAKQGIHTYYCSSSPFWSLQASRVTGMVAYCGVDGTTFCFQPTRRLLADTRNKVPHFLCGSLLEKDGVLIVASPLKDSVFSKQIPSMKRDSASRDQERAGEEQLAICEGKDVEKSKGAFKVFPPKNVAMHRVSWNPNKSSEKWLAYGGAAGLVRCQEVDLADL